MNVLDWIRQNQDAAFLLGVALLIALGMLLGFLHSVVRHFVYMIRGIPPQVTVSCCCECHDEHADEEETED